mmetsp:Transcript_102109/g.288365  ORF Transcript_102109/g.288365 Transcript_102109/m.288365 type:complete len:240 (+) Transcript_102109:105-824(+)
MAIKKVKKAKKVAATTTKEPSDSDSDSEPEMPAKTAPKHPTKEAAPAVPPEEKKKLANEAVDEILQGISLPDAQAAGQAFIPATWHIKYKPVLGGYKKFVQSQTDKLNVVNGTNGNFVVRKAGDTTAAPPTQPGCKRVIGSDWRKDLERAWNTYCSVTPKHERNVDVFSAALPNGARLAKPEGSTEAEKASPKQSSTPPPVAEAKKKKEEKGGACGERGRAVEEEGEKNEEGSLRRTNS